MRQSLDRSVAGRFGEPAHVAGAIGLELITEDGLTQRQLVERLAIEQATMANTLARMERDGLVRRQPHPGDGRAQVVRLTERGRAVYGPAIEAAQAQNAVALGGLDEAEVQLFLDLMRRVIDNMAATEKGPAD